MSGDVMNQEGIELAPITEEQKLAALKTVHQHALDMADKVMLCQMLGIIPTVEGATCAQCDGPLEATSDKLWRARRGDICGACYRRDLKSRKAVEA